MTFASNYTLASNLTVNGNIVINGAVNLITNGYSLIATGAIINNGAIWTGNTLATSFTSSYGGSGGGAYKRAMRFLCGFINISCGWGCGERRASFVSWRHSIYSDSQ